MTAEFHVRTDEVREKLPDPDTGRLVDVRTFVATASAHGQSYAYQVSLPLEDGPARLMYELKRDAIDRAVRGLIVELEST